MYAHDVSTPAKRVETFKPYLQVFDAEGKEPITQGAGGKLIPHHRGIYIGWQILGYDGKKYNFWEMAGGDIGAGICAGSRCAGSPFAGRARQNLHNPCFAIRKHPALKRV